MKVAQVAAAVWAAWAVWTSKPRETSRVRREGETLHAFFDGSRIR
jgi:hypothetical protein